MGSADLLQLVKSVHQPVHIKEYAGKTVAVDGRRGSVVWHSLVSSDSVHGVVDNGGDKNTNISTITPLSTDSTNNDDDDRDKNDDNNNNNNNDKTDKNDDDDDDDNHDNDETLNDNESAKGALLQQLDILRSYDVTPLVVVEGNVLPCDKKKTKGGKSDDHENMDSGNDNEKTMQEQKDAFLKHLDKEKIEYIQAPFESGAQLAYLIETKRVEAALFVDTNEASSSAGDGIAFGCQVTLFGLQSDGSATRVRLSDLTCGGANKEIELRDWSLKSVGELCLMCDCANVQVERAHSLFVKHKKNMRLALQEAVDKRKDVETIYKRMVYRWSQKVYDDKLRRNVSWHKDPALKTKTINKTATASTNTPSSDKKTVKTIRLHQDNKENIPPWLNRTTQEATSQAIHRDNPEPPQQAPKVIAAEQIIKTAAAPLAAKKDSQITAEYCLHQQQQQQQQRHGKLADSSSKAKAQLTMPFRPKLVDKKRKSLDGIDNENSPAGTRGDDTVSNKKRGSQSLPLRPRFGLSDSSNRRHLF